MKNVAAATRVVLVVKSIVINLLYLCLTLFLVQMQKSAGTIIVHFSAHFA